jgi:nitrogen fixation NifU-like protein
MGNWDDFVDELQEQIYDEARKTYGEKGFQRWRQPRYMGRMQNFDASARITGTCGDTMEIYLKFAHDRVESASFFTDGCAASVICGSVAAEFALDKDPDALSDISGDALVDEIGRLPQKDRHCADLAAATVQEAVSAYMKRQAGSC